MGEIMMQRNVIVYLVMLLLRMHGEAGAYTLLPYFAEASYGKPLPNPLLLAAADTADSKKDDAAAKKIEEPMDQERDIYQWIKTYSEVISIIEKKAFRKVNFAEFISDSLKTAVPEKTDGHSSFLTMTSYKATKESVSPDFAGIGVSIIGKNPDDESLLIIEVLSDGPAKSAGILRGDKIVEVAGKKLKGLSTEETVNLLKGKVGTEVTIKVIRDKKPMEFTTKRDMIKNNATLCFYFKQQRIYYLSLRVFAENAADSIATLLRKANDGKCKGIILDLRRNPGGILQAAIEMAGLFLPKESLVVTTKDRSYAVVEKYYTLNEPILHSDLPIFILIDNFSASAAEILAGCLRYHSAKGAGHKHKDKHTPLMVFLLGTSSYGKGSVQEVIPLSNGCALKLTTMLYYLPGDISIQATGIEPDFVVKPKITPTDEMKWIADMYGKESSLKNCITAHEANGTAEPKDDKKASPDKKDDKEADKDGKKIEDDPKKWDERQKEELSNDVAIQSAVTMISMLDIVKKYDHTRVDTRQKACTFLKEHVMTDATIEIDKIG